MALEFVSGFVVSSLLQEIVDAMKSVAADTIKLVYKSDIEIELKNVESTYARAQGMLDTIDGWDLIASKLHRDWLADIRRACYDAEDYTEYLSAEILSKVEDANFLSAFFTKVNASRKLRNLHSDLHSLITESDTHRIPRSSAMRQHHPPCINTEPVVVPLDDVCFRRTQEKNDFVRFFLRSISGSSSRCSSMMTVFISGMFGIGKTTLAQAVMNEPRIQSHFHRRLWVPVLREFDLGQTLRSIIADLQEDQSKLAGCPLLEVKQSVIIRMFEDLCKGRRILIVLDDLCNFVKPQQDWKEFQNILCSCSCAIFGVIITTRNPKVATRMASLGGFPMLRHYLQPMSELDCASLILHKSDSEAANKLFKPNRLGNTTLGIAQKFCKGLPLVADIIGYRLSSNPNMLLEDLWDLPEFRDQIFPAFRLNYSDLSMVLRNCLPYFSLFPNDYKFNKDDLVQLWLAEGYIKPQGGGVQYLQYATSEELGGYAFDEVVSQSILQIESPFDQEPQMYKMHEFIHRYAQYIGSDMYVRIVDQFVRGGKYFKDFNEAIKLSKARHISFICSNIPLELWKDIEKCEGVRTLLSLHEFTKIGQLSIGLFLKLRWLRALVLRRSDIDELPESLGKLKHLRLLDVSETEIKRLPRSTVNLRRLLMLKLNLCSRLLQLPKDISNLNQLLHLEVNFKRLSSMPPYIGKLSKLRTLDAFKVGRKDGHRVTELKNMKYLRGSICLTNLENVKDEAEARETMLSDKPFLKRMELEWKRNLANQSLAEKILTGFEPHEDLEELQVKGYGGARFPSWFSSPECKLTGIQILRCEQCSTLPALGQLQHLKALSIEEMHRVKYIDHQFLGSGAGAGFPSLESLKFQDMMSLEKWGGLQANHMPCLRDLVISDCPNLTSLPQLNLLISLISLEITNCPALEALPKEGLPSSLETLIMINCDLLKESCLSQQGADWEKIKAISNVFMDSKRIPTRDHKRKLASRQF